MRLRKRGDIWHVRYWRDGERVSESTHQTSRKAAETVGLQLERDASDPDHAATVGKTLSDAFGLLIREREEEARAGRKSLATVAFYRQKAGHWVDLFGPGFPLARMNARVVKDFISSRRSEFVDKAETKRISDHTIGKELIAVRAALKLAVREGLWRGDPKAIVPVAFAPEYDPRERWLTDAELSRLFVELDPAQAAAVAFMVATSAEWSCVVRAKRVDVSDDRGRVHLRGTKRKTRNRVVPIVTEWQRSLLEYAIKHGHGTRGLLFAPWPGVGQSLYWACKRAGIDHATPNDLRRTFAQWMIDEAMPLELIAPMMGHGSMAMLQRVYGRMSAATLESRVRRVLWPTGGPPIDATLDKSAKSASDADGANVAGIPERNESAAGGSCEARTRDQRIKSPCVRLWPNPGKLHRKAPGEGARYKGRGPRVAHSSAATASATPAPMTLARKDHA